MSRPVLYPGAFLRPRDIDPADAARALSPYLQRVALADADELAIVARPVEVAPVTLDELTAAVWFGPERVVPVWSGASDATVWSGTAANIVLRAWHDWSHYALSAPFDLPGERAACHWAERRIPGRGPAADFARQVLRAEILGQAHYFARWGAFPDAQQAFVRDWLSRGHRAIECGRYHGAAALRTREVAS